VFDPLNVSAIPKTVEKFLIKYFRIVMLQFKPVYGRAVTAEIIQGCGVEPILACL